MYLAMQKLINKHFYATAEEAQTKIDVFFACNRLTEEQYADLTALIEEVYAEQ